MKIAFVYDRVNKFGGAERVLLALHEIWKEAPLYTAVYNSASADWSNVFRVKPSFLRHLSFLSERHEVLPLLTPLAFESFDFRNFDVVLSVTSAEAKGIKTLPSTLHICYCLTPTRYLWSGYSIYYQEPGVEKFNILARFAMRLFFPVLRTWDFVSSFRPDYYIAISKTVKHRIATYYKKDSTVIYPPVDLDAFKIGKSLEQKKKGYYLIVARLVPYKKIDYVISAFNGLRENLVVIGNGIDCKRLSNMAGKNISIISGGNLTDKKLCWYYQNCKALIFPGEEDFGLTAVEAQACGKPVIAFSRGGVKEGIINGITGELYHSQDADSLIKALKISISRTYNPTLCRQNAQYFSKKKFQNEIKKFVENAWENYNKRL